MKRNECSGVLNSNLGSFLGLGGNAMKKVFWAGLILLAMVGRAGAQHTLPDTCLTLNWNGFDQNPDSIYVDTCLTTRAHPVFWDKGPYLIVFDTSCCDTIEWAIDVIRLGYGAPDSDLEVTWEAIDTAFPQIRSIFESLANNIGPYTLKKIEPDDTVSGSLGSQAFYLRFQNYVSNDSVTSYLSLDSLVSFHLIWYPVWAGVPTPTSNSSNVQLFPNPASEELHVLVTGVVTGMPMELYDGMGRIVKTYGFANDLGTTTLSLRGLSPGFYSIRIGASQRFFIHQ
jgi:hypothetical protein